MRLVVYQKIKEHVAHELGRVQVCRGACPHAHALIFDLPLMHYRPRSANILHVQTHASVPTHAHLPICAVPCWSMSEHTYMHTSTHTCAVGLTGPRQNTYMHTHLHSALPVHVRTHTRTHTHLHGALPVHVKAADHARILDIPNRRDLAQQIQCGPELHTRVCRQAYLFVRTCLCACTHARTHTHVEGTGNTVPWLQLHMMSGHLLRASEYPGIAGSRPPCS